MCKKVKDKKIFSNFISRFEGMFPLCYYPYLHSAQRTQRSNTASRPLSRRLISLQNIFENCDNLIFPVADIKQEPSSPPCSSETDGQTGWGGGGEGGGGDCLYDVRPGLASQTRFKQDTRR